MQEVRDEYTHSTHTGGGKQSGSRGESMGSLGETQTDGTVQPNNRDTDITQPNNELSTKTGGGRGRPGGSGSVSGSPNSRNDEGTAGTGTGGTTTTGANRSNTGRGDRDAGATGGPGGRLPRSNDVNSGDRGLNRKKNPKAPRKKKFEKDVIQVSNTDAKWTLGVGKTV